MSTNNSSTTTIDPVVIYFNNARAGVQYIGQPLLFAVGMIGCILNIIIFMRPSMRSNSCALYFHASSWANIFCLTWGILASMLATYTNNNPAYYNMFYCKLRYFMLNTSQVTSRAFVVLASLDRFLLCSASLRKRRFCRPTIAIKVVLLAVLLCACVNIYILVLYEAQPAKKQCIPESLRLFESIYFWIVPFGIPTVLMSTFGGLTICKLKQNAKRVGRDQVRLQARDRYLGVMLIGQVLLYIITSLPFVSTVLYTAITQNIPGKSPQRVAIENFFVTLFNSFGLYTFNALSFYVYTLTAPAFRRELLELFMPRQWLIRRQQAGEFSLTFINNRVHTLVQRDTIINHEKLTQNVNITIITSKLRRTV